MGKKIDMSFARLLKFDILNRYLYAGSAGYVSFSGDIDTAIAIRTIVWFFISSLFLNLFLLFFRY